MGGTNFMLLVHGRGHPAACSRGGHPRSLMAQVGNSPRRTPSNCPAAPPPPQVVKKERAVGVVPTEPTIYEVLEELAITVQNQLSSRVPFCAFNGEGGGATGAVSRIGGKNGGK